MKHYLPPLLCCLLLMAFTLHAPAQSEKHYTCYRTAENIVADGRLDEPCWSLAEWSDDFADITGNPALKPRFRTRIKMLWDDQYLYLAAELRETDIWATIRKRDAVIFKDNDFEIFLDPDGNGRNYYEIEVNALGTIWDLMLTKAYKEGGKPITRWNLDGMKTGIDVHGTLNDPSSPDTSWIVEMALPLSSLMHGKQPSGRPADGVQWRVNFSRVEWKTEVKGSAYLKETDLKTGKDLPEDNWAWSPMGEVNMHIPGKWGRLEFSSENISPGPLPFKDDKQKTGFGIWLWMGGHDSWKPEQWDSVMTALSSAGISGVLTQADPATLSTMIPYTHKHGITVQKWFITMMNHDTNLIRAHPDWFVISREGKSCITDPAYVGYYRFLCPSNPEVRQYLKTQLDQYLRIPGLDGIHLDYIRYPDAILPQALWSTYGIIQDKEYAPYDYCYCNLCREKFRSLYGTDPGTMEHPDNDSDWRQFRCDQLTSLVKELSDYCHSKGKKLSSAVFPGPSIAKQLVRQSWSEWPLDEVFPMLYQNFYYGSHDWIRRETVEGVKSIAQTVPLYSGLYIPSLTPRELQSAIVKSIEGGAGGVCLFNYEAMTSQHWKELKDVLGK
jgi:uncharacterized lipoprotein YddW (UPF0748 family)